MLHYINTTQLQKGETHMWQIIKTIYTPVDLIIEIICRIVVVAYLSMVSIAIAIIALIISICIPYLCFILCPLVIVCIYLGIPKFKEEFRDILFSSGNIADEGLRGFIAFILLLILFIFTWGQFK